MIWMICTAVLVLIGDPGSGEEEKPRDISGLLEPLLEKHGVPALAGALVVGERIDSIAVVGVRERGSEVAVTLEDRFHIGSLTKSMTAALAGRLVEEGKLSWKTTVGEIFGETLQEMDEAWRPVTLAQLLNHRGGAPENLLAYAPLGLQVTHHEGPPREHRKTLVAGVLARPPAYPPGTRHVYSNDGYAIAGAMLEAVTDTAWRDLITRNLFEPLGLTSIGFGPPCSTDKLDQPRGHGAGGTPVPGKDNPPAYGPGGRVHCTISDLARYAAFHLAGSRGGGKLLKPETFTHLHTPPEGAEAPYAMGWFLYERPWAGGPVLYHNGSNTLWFSVIWVAPAADFAVIAACNQGGAPGAQAADQACGALIRDLLARRAKDAPPPGKR